MTPATAPSTKISLKDIEPGLIIPRRWECVPTPLTASEAVVTIEQCKLRRREILRRIREAAVTANWSKRRQLVRIYLWSQVARVAVWAEVQARRKVPNADPISTVLDGRGLDASAPGRYPMAIIPVFQGEKRRPVCHFANWDKARHTIAHEALKAVATLPPWQFQYNGGEPAAKRWLHAEVPNAKLALTTDFPVCFPLLPWQQVEGCLPFSRQVTRSLLFDPWNGARVVGFNDVKGGSDVGLIFTGSLGEGFHVCAGEIGRERGIPPGSALSSLVAQVTLHLILGEVAAMDGVRLGLYADNLIVLLADPSLEALVRNSLADMAEHHFGHIIAAELRQRTLACKPGDAIKYLGYAIRWQREMLKLDASSEHIARIGGRITYDLGRAASVRDLKRPIARLRSFADRHGCSPAAAEAVLGWAMQVGAAAKHIDRSFDTDLLLRDPFGSVTPKRKSRS